MSRAKKRKPTKQRPNAVGASIKGVPEQGAAISAETQGDAPQSLPVSAGAALRWSADKIERWAIERLKPYERNARTHNEKQIEQIRASLKEFGWTIPVLAREDGTIIAGHGRVAAAKLDGYLEVPVIVARLEDGWNEARCRAYTVADNKLALNSGWDDGILGLELKALGDAGIDLKPIGFSNKELERLLPIPNTQAQNGGVTYESAFQVLIECKDEAEQIAILTRLQKDGVNCRALIA